LFALFSPSSPHQTDNRDKQKEKEEEGGMKDGEGKTLAVERPGERGPERPF